MWASIGCLVIGRRLFDIMNGWEGHVPVGEHVVVASHRPKPDGWYPDAPFTFVDNITDAIAKAQAIAGERTVSVNVGDVGGQILVARLVDEVAMDVVPVGHFALKTRVETIAPLIASFLGNRSGGVRSGVGSG